MRCHAPRLGGPALPLSAAHAHLGEQTCGRGGRPSTPPQTHPPGTGLNSDGNVLVGLGSVAPLNGGGERAPMRAGVNTSPAMTEHFPPGDREIPSSHLMLSGWEAAPRPKSWSPYAGSNYR